MLHKVNDELYVRLDKVSAINFYRKQGNAFIRCDGEGYSCSIENGEALLTLMNNQAASNPAPQPASHSVPAKLIAMTRDTTRGSGSPMWRCFSDEGHQVNVFEHSDPLKDNMRLFEKAGYADHMRLLEIGESLNWTQHPVEVELVTDGKFWKVVSVKDCPGSAMPDVSEDEQFKDVDDDHE
jgi:hypothetical protein